VVRGTVAPETPVESSRRNEISARDAIVYLDAAEAAGLGLNPVPTTQVVRVAHRFEPRVVAVSVGSKVRFENDDDMLYHSVFSVSPIRRFDTGLFGPEHSRTITFDQPGVVELHCGIDDAVGYVLVVPHAVFARADKNGTFTVGPLPRGTWTLRAWHPVWGTATTTAEVGSPTTPVTLRFAGVQPHQPQTSALP